jgi:hypothetical protein
VETVSQYVLLWRPEIHLKCQLLDGQPESCGVSETARRSIQVTVFVPEGVPWVCRSAPQPMAINRTISEKTPRN